MNIDKIVSPKTNRVYSIYSKTGKHLLKKYLKFLLTHGGQGPYYQPGRKSDPTYAFGTNRGNTNRGNMEPVPESLYTVSIPGYEMENSWQIQQQMQLMIKTTR